MSKFQNLDIVGVQVFGKQTPKTESWLDSILKSGSFGKLDPKEFQAQLQRNVEESYLRICSMHVKDLDTDIEYCLFFDNQLKLWNFEFKEQPKDENVELLPNEKFDIIRNDYIKKAVARAAAIIAKADDAYNKHVKMHLEAGDLLDVDDVKLEAIISFAEDHALMTNFKARKFKR